MIDKCECFLFLDTENSLQLSEYGEVTESPWIYYELAQSVTIRKKLPKRLRKHLDKKLLESRQILNLMQIHYRTDLGHLTELSITELQDLANDCQKSQENLLDALYDYFPIQ
jgi:predicted XRE-type DNA-binding protein